MDDGSHRENGRHKVDPYKTAQGQWMMQQHAPSMKQVMSMMTERDAAINERNLAMAEKKAALAERDMAYLQRDAAIAERNNAIMERDNAVAALQYRDSSLPHNNNNGHNNNNNNNNISTCPPGCQISRGVKHMHHPQYDAPYGGGGSSSSDQVQMMSSSNQDGSDEPKSRRGKRAKDPKTASPSKPPRKKNTGNNNNSNSNNKMGYGRSAMDGGDLTPKSSSSDWKDQDLGLNQVLYDESTMPAPVCSCTGLVRQCYKWGNGGWQSSCCTTTMSIYPLPAVPNKRHARVGGRKMSGSAFNKLLSRLAAEGHDISNPVDLKDNWAKHGTNRYITIK